MASLPLQEFEYHQLILLKYCIYCFLHINIYMMLKEMKSLVCPDFAVLWFSYTMISLNIMLSKGLSNNRYCL